MKKKILISLIFIVIILVVIGTFLFFKFNKKEENNNTNNATNAPTSTSTNKTNTIDNASNQITKQQKSIFNSNFDIYVGENVTATQVKSLIGSIRYSNEHSPLRKVTLTINGENTMDSSIIETNKKYSVKVEYDDSGLIYKAIVDEI